MRVKVFANLREIVKVKGHEIDVETKQGKVEDVLEILLQRYGKAFRSAIFNPGGRMKIKNLLNGRDIDYINGLESEIAEHDILYLFPPVAEG
ncbi:MAG: MoaD family protein [Methanophagales archaeon]|nr:MoaD family protein [Methanophagales archaeon]